MTVPATPRKAGPYAGNGVTTSFPFTFKVFAETDIQPVLTDSFGTATNLVLNSDYSVLLNADQDANPGGAVTYPILVGPSPMPAGSTLTIIGNMTLDQTTDVTNSGRFLPQVYENALDKLTILIQQLKEVSDRTLQAAIGTTVKLLFPAPSAGKFIRWRSDLTGLENVEAGTDSIALQGLLGDSTLANRGAGMIGFSSALSYPAGTAGLALKGVADIPNSTDATKGAALVGYKSTATGAVGRTLAAKLSEIISVKDFGAVGDGVTDDAAAIQAALTHAYGLGGATVMLPKGVYIVGAALVLRDNTTLQGAGLGATIIRQKASTALSSTVQTLNAYSLFGTSSIVGPPAINIRDLTIDGNRQTGATGDGLAIYAPLFSIDNIEVCNTSGTGIRTEFGTPGAIPHGYCAQSNMNNSWIHDCNSAGVRWGGPADASIVNCNIYRNLIYNLWLALPAGSGTKVTNCHMWGSTFDARQAGTGVRCDSGGNLLANNVIEGSTVHQVHLRSGGNVIIGGNIYYLSDATNTFGVTLGDAGVPVSLNCISTKIDACRAGAINFTNDQGLNNISVTGYNNGAVGGFGYTGTPAHNTYMYLRIGGDAPVANSSEFLVPATNIKLTGGFGGGTGALSVGAADSAGAGYRLLRIQN
ncbi:glycosyl hydrolase family 28-related protein [Variovorax sp. UC74_104]|uniref:glycosyl hydrolase family 28-related protein n=1 Tax=Variovorax sp. UC74_104 TaxID=3374555 RepID=UPI003756C898